MIDKSQAQVIANAINTLANVLAKPQEQGWMQRTNIERTIMELELVCREVFPVEEDQR